MGPGESNLINRAMSGKNGNVSSKPELARNISKIRLVLSVVELISQCSVLDIALLF